MMYTEKYRPVTLDDVVGQEHVTSILKSWVKEYKEGKFDMPHQLYIGRPGVGKTTVAKALARELFGDNWRLSFRDMNASDDRGIDIIRNEIKEFARSKPISGINIIFLDEADHLTKDAQAALRRIMEDYAEHTRFILSCNYPNKIIEPIRSRCAIFRFRDLTKGEIYNYMKMIVTNEHLNISDNILNMIAEHADGKLRDALNILNSVSAMIDVNEDIVRGFISSSDRTKIAKIWGMIKSGNIIEADKEIIRLYRSGFDVLEIIDYIYNAVLEDDTIPTDKKVIILKDMGIRDYYIEMGANRLLQTRSMIWLVYHAIRR